MTIVSEFLPATSFETDSNMVLQLNTIDEAITRQDCLLLVLSNPRKKSEAQPRKITARPVEIQGTPVLQFTNHLSRQETHDNLACEEAVIRVQKLFPREYRDCHLYTPEADFVFREKPDGRIRSKRKPPTKQRTSLDHNRQRAYLIPDGMPCPFLEAIGVMTPAGSVKPTMYRKFRQINRFLELIDDVVGYLPEDRLIRVVDFGCGKSYLTFALRHLFVELRHREVLIQGLDRNEDVVRQCNEVVNRLGYKDLQFQTGHISDHTPTGNVDLAVSLHACDTATDDTLAQAVKWNASVILAVPCCQHELAPQLESQEQAGLLEFGLLRERAAALLTDALRAQALRQCGYQTQVVEFIDLEHTAKNVLIRAMRDMSNIPNDSGQPVIPVPESQYQQLKQHYGLGRIGPDRIVSTV